jgi:hypothetical protein
VPLRLSGIVQHEVKPATRSKKVLKGKEASDRRGRSSHREQELGFLTETGLEALEAALTRSTDALLRRKNKRRLTIDLDSTADPAHGRQEGVVYRGHFGKNCSIPFFVLPARAIV